MRIAPLLGRAAGIAAIAALAGCAGAPQLYEVKSVYVCAAEECAQAGQRYSAAQMLRGLHRLAQANDQQEFKICAADPKVRKCDGGSIGYFVMGGPIPGRGSTDAGTWRNVQLDTATQSIRVNASSRLYFNGLPLACVEHGSQIAVRAADEIAVEDVPYYCNWMAVGNMTASFSFAVESVDFDRGRLGGYWSHAVAGVGAGKGSGYAVIEFPKSMPRGENWLAP